MVIREVVQNYRIPAFINYSRHDLEISKAICGSCHAFFLWPCYRNQAGGRWHHISITRSTSTIAHKNSNHFPFDHVCCPYCLNCCVNLNLFALSVGTTTVYFIRLMESCNLPRDNVPRLTTNLSVEQRLARCMRAAFLSSVFKRTLCLFSTRSREDFFYR